MTNHRPTGDPTDVPPAGPAYRPSRGVAVTESDDGSVVYLARLPLGPLLVLEDVAATIWTEATRDPAHGWVARVAAAFDETEAAVAADVTAFVADLERRGLLVATEGAQATEGTSATD